MWTMRCNEYILCLFKMPCMYGTSHVRYTTRTLHHMYGTPRLKVKGGSQVLVGGRTTIPFILSVEYVRMTVIDLITVFTSHLYRFEPISVEWINFFIFISIFISAITFIFIFIYMFLFSFLSSKLQRNNIFEQKLKLKLKLKLSSMYLMCVRVRATTKFVTRYERAYARAWYNKLRSLKVSAYAIYRTLCWEYLWVPRSPFLADRNTDMKEPKNVLVRTYLSDDPY